VLLTTRAQPQPRRQRLSERKNMNKHNQATNGVRRGCWLQRIVRCLLGDLFSYMTQESHQSKDSSCQSLCSKTERKEWLVTRLAVHTTSIVAGSWLAGRVLGPLPVIGQVPTKLWIGSIALALLLLFVDSSAKIYSYNRKTPNEKS
jgi:hypothetical protein